MPDLHNPQDQEKNIIHYMGIIICVSLAILGIYQIITDRLQDGIINIIIGTSLLFSFIPFDYKKAPFWQKSLVIIYGLFLIVGIAYVLFMGFSK